MGETVLVVLKYLLERVLFFTFRTSAWSPKIAATEDVTTTSLTVSHFWTASSTCCVSLSAGSTTSSWSLRILLSIRSGEARRYYRRTTFHCHIRGPCHQQTDSKSFSWSLLSRLLLLCVNGELIVGHPVNVRVFCPLEWPSLVFVTMTLTILPSTVTKMGSCRIVCLAQITTQHDCLLALG